MSEADRLAAALKQEQWAHTETAKRGTSYMVAAFDAEQARRIRAEERVERLELALSRVYRDRGERDKVFAECVTVMPALFESERPAKGTDLE